MLSSYTQLGFSCTRGIQLRFSSSFFLFASHPGRVLSLLSFAFLSLSLPLCYAEPRDSFLDTATFWTAIRLDGTRNWKHFARIKKTYRGTVSWRLPRFLRGRSPSFFPLSSNVRGKGYVCQSRYFILSNGFYEAYSPINSSRILYVHVVNILFAHYRDTITFHERVCVSSRITRGQTINGEDFRFETSGTRLDPGRPGAVDEKECQSINTSLSFIRIEFRRKTREHEVIHSRRRTCGDGQ